MQSKYWLMDKISNILFKTITPSFQNPINLLKKDKEISLKKKILHLFWHNIFVMDYPYQCFHDVESSYSLTSMSKNKKTLKVIVQNWSANTSSKVKRYSIQYSSLHWTPFLKKKYLLGLFFSRLKRIKKSSRGSTQHPVYGGGPR